MSSSEQTDRQAPRVAGSPSAAPSAAAAAAAAAAARTPLAPSPSSARSRSRTAPGQRPTTSAGSSSSYPSASPSYAPPTPAASYGAGSGPAASVDTPDQTVSVTDARGQALPGPAEPTVTTPVQPPDVAGSGWATSAPPAPPRGAQRPAPPPHRTAPASSGSGAARSVRLTVAGLDPWSVLKLSFLLSVAIGIALVVASIVLWSVLNGMGVFNADQPRPG